MGREHTRQSVLSMDVGWNAEGRTPLDIVVASKLTTIRASRHGSVDLIMNYRFYPNGHDANCMQDCKRRSLHSVEGQLGLVQTNFV